MYIYTYCRYWWDLIFLYFLGYYNNHQLYIVNCNHNHQLLSSKKNAINYYHYNHYDSLSLTESMRLYLSMGQHGEFPAPQRNPGGRPGCAGAATWRTMVRLQHTASEQFG